MINGEEERALELSYPVSGVCGFGYTGSSTYAETLEGTIAHWGRRTNEPWACASTQTSLQPGSP